MDIQSNYQQAIKFAAAKHLNQTVPGTELPYLVHLSNVAMEVQLAYQHEANFDLAFALKLALLHDTIEDTATTVDELSTEFGTEVAKWVLALTKNDELPKSERTNDSLNRMKRQPKEVGLVKLADRITNIQVPPSHWNSSKKKRYQQEAAQILKQLNGVNTYLENWIQQKINEYAAYI